ncbi:MAG: DNA polymerase III subunit beta [Chloroflexi bacterium]|nr:DNA polymerase III subunit beta [Chloroflexota bacterium]
MKVICLQENLSKALGIVGRAVATRTTLPVTQNVLMSTDQGRLKLSATNLEIAISTWVGGEVRAEGSLTVPARLLTDFVNSLPAERIEIVMTPRPLGIHLESGRSKASIHGTDAEEFPPIPTVEAGVGGAITPKALRTAIGLVAFAAATDDSRPVLTGVRIELEGDKATFAAADGFRLAVHTAPLAEPAAEPMSFIIPAKTLRELDRLVADQQEPVEFTVTPQRSQVLFRLANVELVSQLVQGTFPNYKQLIPQTFGTRTLVSREAFTRVTRTASIFARDGSGIVRLHIIPGAEASQSTMEVSARAEELGENTGEVDVKAEGGEAKIAFNSKYLNEVLGVLSQEEIALETTTPSSPGVIRPVGVDNYTHVIMPMFVQW